MSNPSPTPLWLVYDGDCPFCAATAQMYRLKTSVGALHVVNAREAADTALMREITRQKLDLNQGIVVRFEGKLYHGADALHLLAMLGSDHDWLNRINVTVFRNRALVGLAYPVMKTVRNAVLFVLGHKPI